MARFEPISRRTFIADLGRATLGFIVLGAAACAPQDEDDPAATSAATAAASGTPEASDELGGWHRVNLGNVSAYVLVRGGEAFIVDTGVAGKVSDIEAGLGEAGSSWNEVGHVILTHKHPDHIGSAPDVVEKATEAMVYAGAEDIPSIEVSRDITAVADNDMVGGLRIISTPGHTAGHVSVLDTSSKVFVAGDAIVGADGGIGPSPKQYTEDMDVAMQSVAKIGALDFDIALFGHGEPVTSGASAKVAALADA
jgi:glyoxylase-like metal-dependent hydrolase (beta-lactamase superfamily II)